jgi:hypothetical protein
MNFKCAYDRLPGSYTSKTDASPKSASGKFAEIGTEKRAGVDRTDQLSDRRPIGRTIPLTIPARHAMTKRHSGKNSDVRYAHGVLTAPPRTRARNFFIN